MRRIGTGYRAELATWVRSAPVDCLELTAEHFFDTPESAPRSTPQLPVYVHGLGLSVGTPGDLDRSTLDSFARIVEQVEPVWVSDHVAYTRTGGIDLGHLNPVPRTAAMVRIISDHAKQLADRCRRPVLLENITARLDSGGDLSEPEFLNQICRQGDCALLLDVTNLFINSRNHKFDAQHWLDELDRTRVRQLHVVGYTRAQGGWEDHHAAPMQQDLLELIGLVLDMTPAQSIILERDARLDEVEEIESELAKLRSLICHEQSAK